MKLEKKIPVYFGILLLLVISTTSFIAIYHIHNRGTAQITEYRSQEFAKLKVHLNDIVDIAYGMVEVKYQLSKNDEYLTSLIRRTFTLDSSTALLPDQQLLAMYRDQAQQVILKEALRELSLVRFDNKNGYFWVTDNQLPYPTMIMHAAKPENEGKVMDSPKHNVEKYAKRNIYQARVESCNKSGEAFIEYEINKPGTNEVEQKLSYSRLFAPLGWVISSGIYTDQIEAMAIKKEAEVREQMQIVVYTIMLITGLMTSIGFALVFYSTWQLIRDINLVKDTLKILSLGKAVEKIQSKRKDEIGEMTSSLNALVDGINNYTCFAREIGGGNLNYTYTPQSKEDILGNALLQMRTSLVAASAEEQKRRWSAEGMAIFNDILRKQNQSMKDLGDEVLATLAKYLKINQGGLYVINEQNQDPHLRLVSMYAYNRKKFIEQRVEIGQGLLGQTYLEKETTLLYEIPQNYIRISSGLGDARPANLVIIPLIHNEEAYGILEIASFYKWQAHEIEFIEKMCENLASTINTVQVNERTKKLLEDAQQMAEEMKAQEEELRQNQEEMQASQEEMNRRMRELEEINASLKTELAGPDSSPLN